MAFVPIYILILGFTIVVDYYAGKWIEQSRGKKRYRLLICSLAANIGILATFKYYNFVNQNITIFLDHYHLINHLPYVTLLLPIGLSFHTFQAMSYTIEVYRGNQRAERHFGIYALFVMFYPQLVAGPIERPQNLLHQFYEKHNIDYERITSGLKLMAWGLFKKIVIADRLSILVDNVYDDPYHHHGLSFIIATIFFSFQIYCDFSGYSDIAIGIARVMGFRLMKNFNNPYHAKTIKEFWNRWHISLSTWFKDYLYFPLGGNRVGFLKWCFNLFIVFLVSGLWHGANWTFVAWGVIHGFYMIAGIIMVRFFGSRRIKTDNKLEKGKDLLRVILTFTLVSFAWIFFRAKSIAVAMYVVRSMFTETYVDLYNILHHRPAQLNLGLIGIDLWIAFLSIIFLEFINFMHEKYNVAKLINNRSPYVRWAIYYTFLIVLVMWNISGSKQFIYFQF